MSTKVRVPRQRTTSDDLIIDLVAAEQEGTSATSAPTVSVDLTPKVTSRRSGWHPSSPSTHRPVGLTSTHRNSKKAHDRDAERSARLAVRRTRDRVADRLSTFASDFVDDGVSFIEEVFGPPVAADLPSH